jgi:SAM-dependent methyltransferase
MNIILWSAPVVSCLLGSFLCHAWSHPFPERVLASRSSRWFYFAPKCRHQMLDEAAAARERRVLSRIGGLCDAIVRTTSSSSSSSSAALWSPWALKSTASSSKGRDRSDGDSSSSVVAKPFGRQDYWESFYRNQVDDFSWYSTWNDIEPFVLEWIGVDEPQSKASSSSPSTSSSALSQSQSSSSSSYNILLPGIGADVSLVENLVQAGFPNLYAFDYAQESIDYCRQRISNNSIIIINDATTIDLRIADARDLTCYNNNNNNERLSNQPEDGEIEPFYFDAVIDKGTLDAVYLAGTTTTERRQNLNLAIREMQRLLRPGTGIFWSLSGICTEQLLKNSKNDDDDDDVWKDWQVLVDSSSELYTTRDGYTSNNLDGTLLVWRKPPPPPTSTAVRK